MSQAVLTSVLDMIKKMLQNNEPYDKILDFIDKSTRDVQLQVLREQIIKCTACEIHNCNHTPFTGNIYSEIMFVGEGPGIEEEKQGVPFVGPAGQLFNKMLDALAQQVHPRWAREKVFISNVVKCWPKSDDPHRTVRQPTTKEIAACKVFLDKEIELIRPRVIICVGSVAASVLIHPNFKMTEEHGRFFGDDPKLIAIYHPSYILRRGEETDEGVELKIQCWNDLLAVNDFLEKNSIKTQTRG